jgi:hypothetical protein
MINALDYLCYDLSLKESMLMSGNSLDGSDNRMAMALRAGDSEIHELVEEAIIGDNSVVKLNHHVMSAVVKSGDKRSLELLGNLLLAAKGQEGVRQSILENCDSGTLESHAYFLRLILENDLFRFSSVIRAFDTWSGLSYGDQKQKVAEKCGALAYRYLCEPSAISQGLASSDVTEIYLALWAQCCGDIYSATNSALRLLESPEKYRRLVAWYFITHTNGDAYRHELAIEHLEAQDPEEQAWVFANLRWNPNAVRSAYGYYSHDAKKEQELQEETYYFEIYPNEANKRLALFERLAQKAALMDKKKHVFKESVFPWYTQELDPHPLCAALLSLAAYDRDQELTVRVASFLPLMNSDLRLAYYSRILNPDIPAQRALLLDGLSDKSPTAREFIVKRLAYYTLTSEDVERLTGLLTTKNARLRKEIMSLFEQQELTLMRPALSALMTSKDNNQLIAGAELLEIFSKEHPELQDEYKDRLAELSADAGTSKDVSIILDKIGPGATGGSEYTLENGFGLYDPKATAFDVAVWAAKRPLVTILDDKQLKAAIVADLQEASALYDRLFTVFEQNKNYEYETKSYGASPREKVLLGDSPYWISLVADTDWVNDRNLERVIGNYPLAEKWMEAAGDYATNVQKLLALRSFDFYGIADRYTHKLWFQEVFAGYPYNGRKTSWVKEFYEQQRSHGTFRAIGDEILQAILNSMLAKGESDGTYIGGGVADIRLAAKTEVFNFALSTYINLINKIPYAQLSSDITEESKETRSSSYWIGNQDSTTLASDYLRFWRETAYQGIESDEQFGMYFSEMWYEYLASGQQEFYGLREEDMLRAYELDLISDDAVYFYFTAGEEAYSHMRQVTYSSKWTELTTRYPRPKALLEATIDRIVTLETLRGEIPTPLTAVAYQIQRFNGGARHFVSLLAALGTTGFFRGYSYYYSEKNDITKKECLSLLLKHCQPLPDDTPESLKHMLEAAKIREKRVIEAAAYAPQWAGLLEKATGIVGLKCGVWFFHAHINEGFSAEKETEVALYSAITPQQFQDGTFDKDWFYEAYTTLGEERFNELYKSAKYITDSNSNHRRSQLYTDAVLGRLDLAAIKAEVAEKRNQEKLRALALVPLDSANPGDALERYEYIQRFKKESRQFGAQRQASEGKAVQTALENLAITTGYVDVDRMTWAMEGEKIEGLKPLMEPKLLGNTEVALRIEADGTPGIVVVKGGKELKSLPKALNKDPHVLELKEAVKGLRDQKSRARLSFEMAMVLRTEFTAGELIGLLGHPVLRDSVASLVFAAGAAASAAEGSSGSSAEGSIDGSAEGSFGSAAEGSDGTPLLGCPEVRDGELLLVDFEGIAEPIPADLPLTIAHPYNMVHTKSWAAFQQYIYQNQIVQPFKQVFREYYPVTEDELAAVSISRRYAGNQVQPKKALALLKTRGWTVDYEEGLQRVWHKDNLIVRMYALADWFSPADIEAPTLETVRFFRRDKYELVPFAEIAPIIFSEAMRDIDLAVSVAHAGGVDPETSHSTIEMRIAIARELLAMLSVGNVTFQSAHAHIKGSLGEYSVHMGSGVIHKSGTGMIAVLPVHSQARGKIFLPFADDDPKTAEVLSKILLLADDTKIKDPTILRQMGD